MMTRKGNSCHDIGSLRELRSLQRANEAAKVAAAERVKSGINGVFSLGRVFVSLAQHYAPATISRIIGMLFPFSKQ